MLGGIEKQVEKNLYPGVLVVCFEERQLAVHRVMLRARL